MKRALLVFSLIALFLAGFAGWLERAVKTSLIEDQNKPFLPSKTGCFEAQNNPSSSEARCGNVEYALRCLAEAQGKAVPFLFLLETPTAAEALLKACPTLEVINQTERVLTCAVPQGIAHDFLEKGLSTPGILGFDAVMPVALYGSVATSERFVGTAPLQSVSRLDGRSEVVAVIDTGISTGEAEEFHPNLLPALYGMTVEPDVTNAANLTPEDTNTQSHGTHVAGCLAAQSKYYASVRGAAPGVALYFQRIGIGADLYPSDDIADHFDRSIAVGASIINCSWGHHTKPNPNKYNAYSAQVDRFVWNHPEVLICFAIGNDGVDQDDNSVVDSASVYASEPHAKNCLTVGAQESYRTNVAARYTGFLAFEGKTTDLATDFITRPYDGKNDGMCAFSSRGPLTDGRIAPMLVAPGSTIYSTLKGGSVGAMSGTSMSTPIVSGAAAVLRQYLKEVHQIQSPTAAVVRAGLILASESLSPGQFGTDEMREIPEASPNNVEGWGALRLGKLLQSNETLGFEDRISLKAAKTSVCFEIPNVQAQSQLSVVLSWIDAPDNVAAALVNDYDLTLISPSGKQTTLSDHQNTIERLIVPVVQEAGTWQIQVSATKIGNAGLGNFAAIAWRAMTSESPKALPTEAQGEQVTLVVDLPEGHRPYLDYPVWPAPGNHVFPKGRELYFRNGAKLQPNKPPQSLIGGWLKHSNGERERKTDEAFTQTLEDALEMRWYEAFPGSRFSLR